MSKFPIGITPITIPDVVASTDTEGVTTLWIERLVTVAGPAAVEGRHAWIRLTANQADTLVHQLADKLGLLVFDAEPTKHTFVAADGDPGHCAICDEYDSEHEGYDPERDDFDDEVDTPDDYEGDRYTGGLDEVEQDEVIEAEVRERS